MCFYCRLSSFGGSVLYLFVCFHLPVPAAVFHWIEWGLPSSITLVILEVCVCARAWSYVHWMWPRNKYFFYFLTILNSSLRQPLYSLQLRHPSWSSYALFNNFIPSSLPVAFFLNYASHYRISVMFPLAFSLNSPSNRFVSFPFFFFLCN